LPWEESGLKSLRAFFETAEMTAAEPEEAFGHQQPYHLVRALSFACFCEFLGVFSSAALGVFLLEVIHPPFYQLLKEQSGLYAVLLSITCTVFIGLFAMHLVWALLLEGALQPASRRHYTTALAYGCYTCGWDLLTSPIGLVLSIRYRGLRRGFGLLRLAARVPRQATDAHLNLRLAASIEDRKRGSRRAIIILGSALLLGTLGVIAATLYWLYLSLLSAN
ncbi:MAG: hypothetical protein MK135_07430, partial [Polyangiaceae bacterium]|nr:hypothetical protein [Polyangiaceae bacterium]